MEASDAGGGGDKEAPVAIPEKLSMLGRLRQWLQINGVQFRGCEIRHSSDGAGLGVFASQDKTEGVLMVTPLRLAITPTSVLQDLELGSHFMSLMANQGCADDRLLIILFLVIQRARGRFSFWAPWLDVLPTEFGTTTSFSEDELLELKGTHLFEATEKRVKDLYASFNHKAKPFVDMVLSCVESERREVNFQDFLWANSIFWTRAKSIPCPRSIVFPEQPRQPGTASPVLQADEALSETTDAQVATDAVETFSENEDRPSASLGEESDITIEAPPSPRNGPDAGDSVCVEGVVPGIDFCNHDRTAVTLWEIDGPEGDVTGVHNSMYLVTLKPVPPGEEVYISYGPKGNEELLYLYGFVLEDNPDDYLMIYFPSQALENSVCSETKWQLLEQLALPLRWIVPAKALRTGFHEEFNIDLIPTVPVVKPIASHSWSGHRKASPLAEKVVFPEDLLTAMRILAMDEEQVQRAVSMLEDVSDPEVGRIPSNEDITAALWEACGNAGAFQLLIDLLTFNLMELEDITGTEAMDAELLVRHSAALSQIMENSYLDRLSEGDDKRPDCNLLSDNKRASVIYRMGQKQLVRGFLREAQTALEEDGSFQEVWRSSSASPEIINLFLVVESKPKLNENSSFDHDFSTLSPLKQVPDSKFILTRLKFHAW